MIAVIDYGMGNLGSVAKAFDAIGAKALVTDNPKDLNKSSKIVLPGVGAFGDAMKSLRKLKLIPALMQNISDGKPYLGLCLGMQVLFDESEEGRKVAGLGILKGKVKRFKFKRGIPLKVPHMGWNTINTKNGCPLFRGIPDNAWMYFVHSYYVAPKDRSVIAATTGYGMDFTSAICKDNIFGTQFHPEKSQGSGMDILNNFVKL